MDGIVTTSWMYTSQFTSPFHCVAVPLPAGPLAVPDALCNYKVEGTEMFIGRSHVHGFVELKVATSLAQLIVQYPNVHWIATRNRPIDQVIDYCTRGANYTEYGVRPQ